MARTIYRYSNYRVEVTPVPTAYNSTHAANLEACRAVEAQIRQHALYLRTDVRFDREEVCVHCGRMYEPLCCDMARNDWLKETRGVPNG